MAASSVGSDFGGSMIRISTRACVVLAACLAVAARARADAPSGSDPSQDIVVLAPQKPLLIRLQITCNGAPFRQTWDGFLNRVFRELDRDGDGRLSAAEAAKCPPLRSLQLGAAADGQALQQRADDNGGFLSREEFAAFHAERGAKAFVAGEAAGQATSNRALFELLDTNGDRRLSAEELDAAVEALRSRDFNDDEIISEAELRGARTGDDALLARITAAAPAALGRRSPLVVLEGAAPEAALAQTLLAQYDRDGDGFLACAQPSPEIELTAAARSLDADGDGRLSLAELERFARRAADVELRFAFGTGRWQAGLDSQARPRRGDALRVSRRTDGAYKVDLANAVLEFRPNNRDPLRTEDVRLDFTVLDADNNEYLELQEVEAQLGAAAFAAMDVDDDGKVLRREFDPYVRRPLEAGAARIQFTVADQGQQLFEKFDENGDGRLTARELRRARALLDSEDRDGDGAIAAGEIPRHLRFDLARGDQPLGPRARALGDEATPPAANVGPLWFQRMDANGDGDVSFREFLGPRTAFDRLDANGDGLIDAAEAESAP